MTKEDVDNLIRLYAKQENQEAKADQGKPRITLVPRKIFWDIASVREFGTKKYVDPDNWKRVEIDRYRDAAFRHFLQYLDDPHGTDDESGLPHLWHLATNIAFLCEMETYEKTEHSRTTLPSSVTIGCESENDAAAHP